MPHSTFGAVRLTAQREPITFTFGVWGEDVFTVVPEPSLGDCFDLADAPEPVASNMLEAAAVLARFIERMLDVDDRPRFREALKRIPASEAHVIVEAATWITEQVTGFPTGPSKPSSVGRPITGRNSKPKPAGSTRLRK